MTNAQRLERLKELYNRNQAIPRSEFKKAFELAMRLIAKAVEDLAARIDARLAKVRDGMDGRDGKNGLDGIDGKDGRDGKDGKPGQVGPPGPQGDKGDRGEAGSDGKDGADGQDGKNGEVRYMGVGWGAHPLMIQGLGVVIDKNVRMINFTGSAVASVTRTNTGVVTVNIAAPSSGGTVVDQEVPTDSGDHLNFTIAHAPISGTLKVYRGGAKQASIGTTPDYSLSGTTLTLTAALNAAAGEQLICDYQY